MGTDAAVTREINVHWEKLQTTMPLRAYYLLCRSDAAPVVGVTLTDFSSVCESAGRWLENFALLFR